MIYFRDPNRVGQQELCTVWQAAFHPYALAPTLSCNASAISLLTLANQGQRSMPSKTTALAFGMGVITAAAAAWVASDHSVAKTSVFLLAMLFGGSMYFLMRARD